MRFAIDTGGTFTDLVLEDASGHVTLHKSPTTPDDPVRGVLNVLRVGAEARGRELADLLGEGELLIYATTRSINAVLTGTTAKTALLTTAGHPDILLFREGGRTEPFNHSRDYPQPYIPRADTFEVPERIGAQGEVVASLDEEAVLRIIEDLRARRFEAVAVCLLWSVANPEHERRIGQLLERHLSDVPYTLSHQLNPTLREYRRASSTAIDASLKPVMTEHLRRLSGALRTAGFAGRVLMVASTGGVLDVEDVADSPIHSLGSGPAMAPIAGRAYAERDAHADTAIVADTGGTSYDVSLVRRGRIPWTRETWIGAPYLGHMTGFPSVDVKSIGAGGGSIAWVDEGGLLHVGPQSAGSVPGPACYGRGGTHATVTDACLTLGYIDVNYFLGGAMRLDAEAARNAIAVHVGDPLGVDGPAAAASIMKLTTEHMVRAIEEITLYQGIDPRAGVLVGGGGAAGLNAVAIARRLGCHKVVIPAYGATLSAAGALMSDLTADFAASSPTTTDRFDVDKVNDVLAELERRCQRFIAGPGSGAHESSIEYAVEARYPYQVWELDVPLRVTRFACSNDVDALRRDFHQVHHEVFGIDDPGSEVELVAWRARARCRLRRSDTLEPPVAAEGDRDVASRMGYFPGVGFVEVPVHRFEAMETSQALRGPAIVESALTTVVVDPGASAERGPTGSLIISPDGRDPSVATAIEGAVRQ